MALSGGCCPRVWLLIMGCVTLGNIPDKRLWLGDSGIDNQRLNNLLPSFISQ
tara:strand:- start:411 stop:566 length:156 start_codon:yes stop_codon:yes gene_type:complete